MSPTSTHLRRVRGVSPAHRTTEGDGFIVDRAFPTARIESLDPFLLLDEMVPRTVPPGSVKGAPDHPHRGFETVTYVLEGELAHADSAGHRDVIRAGDVQWMTAGAGIVHSEMPSAELQRSGGRLHGFQLWVNLPAAEKMTPPRYQAIPADALPIAEGQGFRARVIAGKVLDVTGPARTHTPIAYADLTLEPGADVQIDFVAGWNVAAYVVEGSARFGPEGVRGGDRDLVAFAPSEGAVQAEAGASGLRVLLLAGRPLREPVARYGPFVMNTRAELVEAFEDFQSGRMGAIRTTGRH